MVSDHRTRILGERLIRRLLATNGEIVSVESIEYLLDHVSESDPAWRTLGVQIKADVHQRGYRPVERTGWHRTDIAE